MQARILFSLLAASLCAFATPMPAANGTEALEKRVTHTGRGTFYHPSTGTGNCGFKDNDNSPAVAIGIKRYNDNGGGNCNQWIKITNTANGKTAFGLTRDSCESCGTEDLDMSPSVFQKLAPLSQGVITISWNFEPKGFQP